MKKNTLSGIARFAIAGTAALGLFACNGGGAGGGAQAAETFSSSDNLSGFAEGEQYDGITLAVNYVAYERNGKPVLTQEETQAVFAKVNKVIARCGIRYKLEEYKSVNPADAGLEYNMSSMNELDQIRGAFESNKALVVVGTGSWDKSGMGPANAWAAMPGQFPAGVVMEAPVVDNANIVAHELGHYLSLDHSSNQSNLMSPVIYDTSTHLSETQCADMRETASSFWTAALR